jgi:hydantoinase/carbamoylase family amidase
MKIHERLAELATLGATAEGIDRALCTAPEHAARERFARWAQQSGLTVEQDRASNVFVRLPGREQLAPIQCGSHLDTVKDGGAYDGAYGVIGGLEALEMIASTGVTPRRPIEVVAWAGEEGSRFPLGCIGSSIYAGLTPLAKALPIIGDDGVTFGDALASPSGLLRDVPVRDGFPPPVAYVELHIEQGPIMERTGVRLGVVTAIAGQRRYHVEITGQAGHAGTMPMTGRADALCAASELTLAVERAAFDVGNAVATVGRLVVEPNQTNIVPGHVSMRIDVRSVDDARVAAIEERIRDTSATIEQGRSVRIRIEPVETRRATAMNERLRKIVRDVCAPLDPKAANIASGAGHDAMCVASVAPVAMIFVPSIDGQSHVGTERTAPEDLELGVTALMGSLLAFDHELTTNP